VNKNGRDSQQAKIIYDKHFSLKKKQRTNTLAGKVKLKRKETPKQIIHKEFQDWVEDTWFTRSWDTKFFMAMEFYWLTKTLVALSMDNKDDMQ
jgi:hypothetical protein